MKKHRIAVTWEMCGYIDVEAKNLEDAMNMVRENPDDFPLPVDGGDYVNDSFRLSTEYVEEMEMICGL